MPFEKMRVFFKKKTKKLFLHQNNFSQTINFRILLQKTQLTSKRHLQEILPFDRHSSTNWPFLPIMEKETVFFKKDPTFF